MTMIQAEVNAAAALQAARIARRRADMLRVSTPLADMIGANATVELTRGELWTLVTALRASRPELADAFQAALMSHQEFRAEQAQERHDSRAETHELQD